jgi:hypothetical protein
MLKGKSMYLPQYMINIIIGLSIPVGAVQCFFGYRIFRFILGLTGFLFGGSLACVVAYIISQEELVALLAGIIGGFIGAALMSALYFIGIFLIGAFLGGVMGTALFAVAKSSPNLSVLFILAVIAGVITLIFQKSMIIISTGFGGAWSMVIGIAYFIAPANLERMFGPNGIYLYTIVLSWLALGMIGVFVQHKYREEESSAPDRKQIAALSHTDKP